MSGFAEIHQEMDNLTKEIETLSGQVEEKRMAYEEAKDTYAAVNSEAILSGKLLHEDWTQTDLKAFADKESRPARTAMILAQSAYRKVKNEKEAKERRLEVVNEKSRNLRSEVKRFGG